MTTLSAQVLVTVSGGASRAYWATAKVLCKGVWTPAVHDRVVKLLALDPFPRLLEEHLRLNKFARYPR